MQPVADKIPHEFSIHGKTISDNYSWLRDKGWPNVTDKKVLTYLEDENNYFENYFKKNQKLKDEIFEELKGRIKLTDTSTYTKWKNYYYYSRTEEDKEYPIHCRKNGSISAAEEVFLDENELAKDHKFTSVKALAISPSQKLLAYSVDHEGNEKSTIFVKNLETGKLLEDKIEMTIGSVEWHEDESGFFYTPSSENWRQEKIIFHKLGTNITEDELIMHETNSLFRLSIGKSSSKEFFIINSSGHESSEIYYFSMNDKEFKPIKFLSRRDKIFYNVDHGGGYFYVHSNDKGANFRLARIPDATPLENNLQEYLACEPAKYLSGFDITESYIIANYKSNALPEIDIYRLSDKVNKKILFPDGAFTAGSYSANYEENDIRVDYSSLKRPNTTYTYNFDTEELTLLRQQEIPSGFNPDEYEVKRVFADNNGVKIPLTVFYKKSLFKNDGSNPTYLNGYGSYGYSIPPSFRNTAITLANRGFVFAIAHIRGGDDLGFEWYESAKFLNKKNTFEDFLSCAHFLIDEKYTSKGKITIAGGSAGGLLIGYSINKEPELFKAAIAHVPFVDVINTMLDESLPLTPGEFKEWGNPKEKEYFEYMLSYSPYDNISKQAYPSLYVTAGLSDPRVTYWEAAKWVAKLRENKIDNNILLFKTNMSAGHAGASGRFDYLKEVAEDYTFVFSVYGLR